MKFVSNRPVQPVYIRARHDLLRTAGKALQNAERCLNVGYPGSATHAAKFLEIAEGALNSAGFDDPNEPPAPRFKGDWPIKNILSGPRGTSAFDSVFDN